MRYECPHCDVAVILEFKVGVPISLIKITCPYCKVAMEYIGDEIAKGLYENSTFDTQEKMV